MNKEDNSKERVGYRSPPRHSRFKPGHSGNPKGRPKGSVSFGTLLRSEMTKPVGIGEDSSPLTKQEAVIRRLIDDAVGGNLRATGMLLSLMAAVNGTTSDSVIGDDVHDDEYDDELINKFGQRAEGGSNDPQE